jgi:hypothetical protein
VWRDGAAYGRWTYDGSKGLLTLDGEGRHSYAILFEPSGTAAGVVAGEPPLRVWIAGRDAVRYRIHGSGSLAYDLVDPLGRRIRSGRLDRPGGEGEIPLLGGLPSGVYILVTEISDPVRFRAARKLVVTR